MQRYMKLTGDRRSEAQKIDLFGRDRQKPMAAVPAWLELPAETRAALTSLMARLILEHADKSRIRSTKEAGHDL
jgi:hypothetical protein